MKPRSPQTNRALHKQEEKQRSLAQNNSLHRWVDDVASALEELGISRKTVVKDLSDAEIPITGKYIKEVVWQHFMVSMYGKTSTTELLTHEVKEVAKAVAAHLQEKYKIQVEWWSRDAQAMEALLEKYK